MEEIIYSQNNNSTISCYSMDFSGISKQNAHGGRNVMPRCLSEGVDIFLKSVERQGESGHDVRVSQAMCAWLLVHMDGVCRRPRHNEKNLFTFRRKFTPGDVTSRRDVPFTVGVRGVYDNPTLRAMHSIHKCVAKSAPHLLAVLRNEPRYS